MSSLAELEALQAEKGRQLRVGSPRRRPVRPGSATTRRPGSAASPASPGSPTMEAESPLRPEMTLAAAGLRRASTPGPGGDRRNSDVPAALRGLPGAVALAAAVDGVGGVQLGRVSSASSAVQERRRSIHAALGDGEGDAEERSLHRKNSATLAAEIAAMIEPGTQEMAE